MPDNLRISVRCDPPMNQAEDNFLLQILQRKWPEYGALSQISIINSEILCKQLEGMRRLVAFLAVADPHCPEKISINNNDIMISYGDVQVYVLFEHPMFDDDIQYIIKYWPHRSHHIFTFVLEFFDDVFETCDALSDYLRA